MRVTRLLALVLLNAIAAYRAPVRADETDQYSVPTGREFADLQFWLSNHVYDKIEKGVAKTNERIRQSLQDGRPTAATCELQAPLTIVAAVEAEFPSFLNQVQAIQKELTSDELTSCYPGLVTIYLPRFWIYHHGALVADVLRAGRLKRSSTLMANGTYFGTDKIMHFAHVGYLYFREYQKALDEGCSEEQAMCRAIDLGGGTHFISERRLLGFLGTGVISNGDIAADYAGLKFYRNLTEPMRIKGEIRPPLLIRDGERYRLNTHVRRNSNFFNVFVSDHWNEALNPSGYSPITRPWVHAEVRKRCPEIVNWYRHDDGRHFTKQDFERVARELSTYYGEEYGHYGNLDEMVTIANVCFTDASTESPSLTARPVHGSTVRLVSHTFADPPAGSRDVLGRTPLWWAARAGRTEEVRRLLGENRTVLGADVDGETPLLAAVRGDHNDVANVLLQHEADPNASNLHGLTPLHLAAQRENVEAIELLLGAGAEVDARDNFGCTPLHDAAMRGTTLIAYRLVRAGASVDIADRFGRTPLQRAVRSRNAEVAAALRAADTYSAGTH